MCDLINREAALAAVADAIADGRNVYRALADVPVVEDGMYICRDGALYKAEFGFPEGTKTVTLPEIKVGENIEDRPVRMTCREWMQRNMPEDCDADCYCGGVYGCPYNQWLGKVRRLCGSGGQYNDEICGDCWDQPCPEGGADDAAD